MRSVDDGETVAITLRVSKKVLAMYAKIALRANGFRVNNGKRGNVTAQDIMRHRLSSLPGLKLERNVKGGRND